MQNQAPGCANGASVEASARRGTRPARRADASTFAAYASTLVLVGTTSRWTLH